MRWIWLLLLVTFNFAVPARAQSVGGKDSAEEIRKEVLKVEEEQDQAVARSDLKTLDRIWADRLVYTTPNGELLTKEQHLADFQSGIRKFDTMKHDDIVARVYGKTVVVVTGRSTSTLHYKGEVSVGPRRFTNVFVKMDGRWQMVTHHVTDVAKQ